MVTSPRTVETRPHPIWSALVGLTSLGVLLQARWAGLIGLAVWLPMTARRR